jgi:hypothetical protein
VAGVCIIAVVVSHLVLREALVRLSTLLHGTR